MIQNDVKAIDFCRRYTAEVCIRPTDGYCNHFLSHTFLKLLKFSQIFLNVKKKKKKKIRALRALQTLPHCWSCYQCLPIATFGAAQHQKLKAV